jgi:phosphoglycolate phosphatase
MGDTILIFDFDGTIADTHHYIVHIANRLAPEYGYKQIDWEEVETLRDKTAKEMIEHLKVPVLKIPAILARAKRVFHEGIDEVKLIDGLHDVLHELHERGILMGIVSSNAAKNIERFLANHDLKVFDFLHSTTKIWSKHHSLEKLIKQRAFPKERVCYIGDETRDISAAHKTGVRSVSVSWGYNSAKALAAHTPDFLVETPSELLQFA